MQVRLSTLIREKMALNHMLSEVAALDATIEPNFGIDQAIRRAIVNVDQRMARGALHLAKTDGDNFPSLIECDGHSYLYSQPSVTWVEVEPVDADDVLAEFPDA